MFCYFFLVRSLGGFGLGGWLCCTGVLPLSLSSINAMICSPPEFQKKKKTYLPTQGRKILNKEGNNTLLANLKGYLQNLLLIWFHFSITSKRMPQCKYVFLSILESLTAHTQIHEQHAFCTMVFSVHKNSIRAQHINQRTTKTVN